MLLFHCIAIPPAALQLTGEPARQAITASQLVSRLRNVMDLVGLVGYWLLTSHGLVESVRSDKLDI